MSVINWSKFKCTKAWTALSIEQMHLSFSSHNYPQYTRCDWCGYHTANYYLTRRSMTSGNTYDNTVCRDCAVKCFKNNRQHRLDYRKENNNA